MVESFKLILNEIDRVEKKRLLSADFEFMVDEKGELLLSGIYNIRVADPGFCITQKIRTIEDLNNLPCGEEKTPSWQKPKLGVRMSTIMY